MVYIVAVIAAFALGMLVWRAFGSRVDAFGGHEPFGPRRRFGPREPRGVERSPGEQSSTGMRRVEPAPERPLGPDDDPDFIAHLAEQQRRGFTDE